MHNILVLGKVTHLVVVTQRGEILEDVKMRTSITVLGALIILVSLFLPLMYLGFLLVIGLIIIIVGLCMESTEQNVKAKVMKKRKLCRICGIRITKAQIEITDGLCKECFEEEFLG